MTNRPPDSTLGARRRRPKGQPAPASVTTARRDRAWCLQQAEQYEQRAIEHPSALWRELGARYRRLAAVLDTHLRATEARDRAGTPNDGDTLTLSDPRRQP
jgi:hypothetical protein